MMEQPQHVPPPPPPPPPRTAEYGWGSHDNSEKEAVEGRETPQQRSTSAKPLECKDTITTPRDFVLNVKCPRSQQKKTMYDGDTPGRYSDTMDAVQIQLYPDMTFELLAQCVTQAVAQFTPNTSGHGFPSLLVVRGHCKTVGNIPSGLSDARCLCF